MRVSIKESKLEERRWGLVQKSWDNALSDDELAELKSVEGELNVIEKKRSSGVAEIRSRLAASRSRLMNSINGLISELEKKEC